MNSWSILVIFERFWGILSKLEFHEKGQLLAGICPEGAEKRLETGGLRTEGSATENAEDTEKKSGRWAVESDLYTIIGNTLLANCIKDTNKL
jgi:hypothetical protein